MDDESDSTMDSTDVESENDPEQDEDNPTTGLSDYSLDITQEDTKPRMQRRRFNPLESMETIMKRMTDDSPAAAVVLRKLIEEDEPVIEFVEEADNMNIRGQQLAIAYCEYADYDLVELVEGIMDRSEDLVETVNDILEDTGYPWKATEDIGNTPDSLRPTFDGIETDYERNADDSGSGPPDGEQTDRDALGEVEET